VYEKSSSGLWKCAFRNALDKEISSLAVLLKISEAQVETEIDSLVCFKRQTLGSKSSAGADKTNVQKVQQTQPSPEKEPSAEPHIQNDPQPPEGVTQDQQLQDDSLTEGISRNQQLQGGCEKPGDEQIMLAEQSMAAAPLEFITFHPPGGVEIASSPINPSISCDMPGSSIPSLSEWAQFDAFDSAAAVPVSSADEFQQQAFLHVDDLDAAEHFSPISTACAVHDANFQSSAASSRGGNCTCSHGAAADASSSGDETASFQPSASVPVHGMSMQSVSQELPSHLEPAAATPPILTNAAAIPPIFTNAAAAVVVVSQPTVPVIGRVVVHIGSASIPACGDSIQELREDLAERAFKRAPEVVASITDFLQFSLDPVQKSAIADEQLWGLAKHTDVYAFTCTIPFDLQKTINPTLTRESTCVLCKRPLSEPPH
jgi:hypothetical protein